MTAQDLGETPDARPASGSAPRARVWLPAVAANIRRALDALPAGSPRVADLRADAWGHGAAAIAAQFLSAGVDRLRVDADQGQAVAGASAGEFTTADAPTIDPLVVYGLPGAASGARPVMRLTGTVLSVKDLRAGEGVSYGYRHRAPSDTRIALVTGGYAQGIVRALGGRASVAVAGVRVPIIGRVAMDVCVIDVGAHEVGHGDRVVFFGDPGRGEPGLEEWVRATGLRPGEIVAAVGARADREFAG